MAVIVDTSLPSGVQVNDSYARIESIAGNKNKLTAYLSYYVSAEAANGGAPAFKQSAHEFVPSNDEDSPRWDKQAYEYIKTLEEFSDAVDA